MDDLQPGRLSAKNVIPMESILPNAPVTKLYAFSAVTLSVLCSLKVLEINDVFYHPLVVKMNGEWYRLFTGLIFYGDFNVQSLVSLISFSKIASDIESVAFAGNSADFIIFLLFGAISNWIIASFTNQIIFSTILRSMVFYYYSKSFKDQTMRIQGLPFDIKGSFAPFIITALSLYEGGPKNVIFDVLGIVVGHIYYFIHDVMQVRYGTSLLQAPVFLRKLLNNFAALI